jgi:hypothetical protein
MRIALIPIHRIGTLMNAEYIARGLSQRNAEAVNRDTFGIKQALQTVTSHVLFKKAHFVSFYWYATGLKSIS